MKKTGNENTIKLMVTDLANLNMVLLDDNHFWTYESYEHLDGGLREVKFSQSEDGPPSTVTYRKLRPDEYVEVLFITLDGKQRARI